MASLMPMTIETAIELARRHSWCGPANRTIDKLPELMRDGGVDLWAMGLTKIVGFLEASQWRTYEASICKREMRAHLKRMGYAWLL